jgi:hypothetical protein
MAIDVFYLTAERKKLAGDHLKQVEAALTEALQGGPTQTFTSAVKPPNL